jgi:hypothetical protein
MVIPSISLTALVAVLILGLQPAYACRCADPSLASAIKRADVVFWGEITDIAAAKDDDIALTVTVRGVWKGRVTATMVVLTGRWTCGLRGAGANVGSRWLFTPESSGGALHAEQCDGSRLATAEVRATADKIAGAAHAP